MRTEIRVVQMMFKTFFSCVLIFGAAIARAGFVMAETLEDIKSENKILQMEIADLEAKIADLENNPGEHPDCSGLRVQMNSVKNAGADVKAQTLAAQTEIADLDAQISKLKSKQSSLDSEIKKQKDLQVGFGVTAGVAGAGAAVLGVLSHFEKNKIDDGAYTQTACVDKVFADYDTQEKINAWVQYAGGRAVVTNMLVEVVKDCRDCCPGKSSECSAWSDRIGNLINSSSTVDAKTLCGEFLNANTIYDAVAAASNKFSKEASDNYSICHGYIKTEYGAVAVNRVKVMSFAGNAEQQKSAATTECGKLCSSGDARLEQGYNNDCISACNGMSFQVGASVQPPYTNVMSAEETYTCGGKSYPKSTQHNCRLGFEKVASGKWILKNYLTCEESAYPALISAGTYVMFSVSQQTEDACANIFNVAKAKCSGKGFDTSDAALNGCK